jgi:predicted metal-binding membrane protein
MMLPSAAPMVLTFDAVQTARNRQGRAIVGTWVFVGGYLLVWALTGVVAYAAAVGAGWVSASSPSLASLAPRLAGTVILAAGLYQLSPLKDRCLSRCRTPTQFVLAGWRNGRLGALRMGLEHGLFCLGCCWLLFALLLPLGIMNIAAMAAVTLFVLAEKALPGGLRLVRVSAAVLMVAGAAITLFPALLPVV